MDLVTVICFLVLYYIRPQEWSGAFAAIHFVQIIMLTALATLFTRPRGLRPADLFRTPHDWMVFGFCAWIVMSAVSPWDTFKENVSLYIFYIVIVQTLYSIPRMMTFIGWWTFLIVTVASLALASLAGFDPLGSVGLIEDYMKGRLALNLSIFNNPNALGHSVVPSIPMIYYYCIWKRPVAVRVFGVALLAIPLTCIFLTVSKGAFLSGGITILATALFGRPKSVQAIIIAAALMFGTSAIYSLPRMDELNKSKGDAAIKGRVAAFKHGYKVLTVTKTGVGKGEWFTSFFDANRYTIAAHSSYVMIGAELGYPGLFLLCGIFFCSLRTLVTAKTESPDEERIRRILFVLVISYAVSSWMVNFEYRPTFFMFSAAIAAFHRHLHGLLSQEKPSEAETEVVQPAWRTALLPQPALGGALANTHAYATTDLLTLAQEPATEPAASPTPVSRIGRAWNRIGLVDLALTWLMMRGVVRFWAYIMMRM